MPPIIVVLFVLGPPGAGKTTLVRQLLGEHEVVENSPVKITRGEDVIAAGHYTGKTFDGADTVPYTGARAWLDYMLGGGYQLVDGDVIIFDGDRFSNGPVLEYLHAHPHVRVKGVYLNASDEKLKERRTTRGSRQNEVWMRGRLTKAKNFAAKIDAKVVDANTCDTQAIADEVTDYLYDGLGAQ